METQKILALEEVRLFHPGCQVHTWVDSGKKGLNLQPRLQLSFTMEEIKKWQENGGTLDKNYSPTPSSEPDGSSKGKGKGKGKVKAQAKSHRKLKE